MEAIVTEGQQNSIYDLFQKSYKNCVKQFFFKISAQT